MIENLPLRVYNNKDIDLSIKIDNYIPSDLYWMRQLQLHAPFITWPWAGIVQGFENSGLWPNKKKITIEFLIMGDGPVKNPGVLNLLVCDEDWCKGRGKIFLKLRTVPNISPIEFSFKLADWISGHGPEPKDFQ